MHSWNCPCGSTNWPQEKVCPACGRPFNAADPTLLDVPAQPKKTDVCAVLADAFGVLGLWLLPILFGPAAVILGAVSLHRLRENPALKGALMAWVGLLLGVYCTGVSAYRMNAALNPPPSPVTPQPVILPTPPVTDAPPVSVPPYPGGPTQFPSGAIGPDTPYPGRPAVNIQEEQRKREARRRLREERREQELQAEAAEKARLEAEKQAEHVARQRAAAKVVADELARLRSISPAAALERSPVRQEGALVSFPGGTSLPCGHAMASSHQPGTFIVATCSNGHRWHFNAVEGWRLNP